MELAPGHAIEDRYVVEAALGRGGMAVVYRVRHVALGSHHALKILSGSVSTVRDRLLREGQVQAAMRHPNVVAVTDVVSVDGQPGLIMEYVEGPGLDALLEERTPTMAQTNELFRGILDAVATAHEHGLVHRDLKPANVLLSVEKGALVPKVADFGLAKLLESAPDDGRVHTRTGAALGTPPYMAPEQIRDASSVDTRADVFALGAIAYELLTGERAFDGDDAFEIFSSVTSGEYVPVRERLPDIPARMAAAIEAALTVDREERPETAGALRALWFAGTDAGDSSWGDLVEAAGRLSTGHSGFTLGSGGTASEPTYDPDLAPGSDATWADGAVAEDAASADTFDGEEGAFDADSMEEPQPQDAVAADPSDADASPGEPVSVETGVTDSSEEDTLPEPGAPTPPPPPASVPQESSDQRWMWGLAVGGLFLGMLIVIPFVLSERGGLRRGPPPPPPVPEVPDTPEADPPSAPMQPGRPGRVVNVGDTEIRLRRDGMVRPAGKVKPGTWEILLVDGDRKHPAGPIDVEPGETVRLRCSLPMRHCKEVE